MMRATHVQLQAFWDIKPLDYHTVQIGFAARMREFGLDWMTGDYAPDYPEIVSDILQLPAVPPAWHQDLHGSLKPRGLVVWSNILATEISIDGLLGSSEVKDLSGKPIQRGLQERLSTTYLTLGNGSINVIDNTAVYHRGPSQLRLVPQMSMPFKRAFCRAWLTDECADRILNV